MKIFAASSNKTKPLPYADDCNNNIYNFFPQHQESYERTRSSEVDNGSKFHHAKQSTWKRSKLSPTVPDTPTYNPFHISRSSSLRHWSKRSHHKRRNVSVSPPPTPINTNSPFTSPSSSQSTTNLQLQAEFSFDYSSRLGDVNSSTSTSSSDMESLPDLSSGEETTPLSSPMNDLNSRHVYLPDVSFDHDKRTKSDPAARSLLQELRHVQKTGQACKPIKQQAPPVVHKPSIFDIPELVHKIVSYAEASSNHVPQERAPIRRRPLSYQHAFLIHGDRDSAQRIMSGSEDNVCLEPATSASPLTHSYNNKGLMYNLLQVNRLFYQVTTEIMNSQIYFDDEIKFIKFINFLVHDKPHDYKLKPKLLVLHKLYSIKQTTMQILCQHIDFSDCEWLEIYMCPKLVPLRPMFQSGKLKKLIVTGSRTLDDEVLVQVSQHCPQLQVLDIRACELVSDSGVYHIGSYCGQLTSVNLGRKNKGSLVTDVGINRLIKNNPQLSTVGLAGCYITDRTVWDLAIYCNESLTRLSLNNCPFVSDQSIPVILSHNFYWQNLSVLELRFVYQITHFKPIIEFKRRQEYGGVSMLVEVCETLMIRWRQQELEMDKLISQKIFEDISSWVNEGDDEDGSFEALLQLRGRA